MPGADPFDLLFSDQSARLSTAVDDMSDDHVGDVDNLSRQVDRSLAADLNIPNWQKRTRTLNLHG